MIPQIENIAILDKRNVKNLSRLYIPMLKIELLMGLNFGLLTFLGLSFHEDYTHVTKVSTTVLLKHSSGLFLHHQARSCPAPLTLPLCHAFRCFLAVPSSFCPVGPRTELSISCWIAGFLRVCLVHLICMSIGFCSALFNSSSFVILSG